MVKVNIDIDTPAGRLEMRALLDEKDRAYEAFMGKPIPKHIPENSDPVPPVSAGSSTDPGVDPTPLAHKEEPTQAGEPAPARVEDDEIGGAEQTKAPLTELLAAPPGTDQAAGLAPAPCDPSECSSYDYSTHGGADGSDAAAPAPVRKRKPARVFVEPEDWQPLVARVLAGEREKDVADGACVMFAKLHGRVLAARARQRAEQARARASEPATSGLGDKTQNSAPESRITDSGVAKPELAAEAENTKGEEEPERAGASTPGGSESASYQAGGQEAHPAAIPAPVEAAAYVPPAEMIASGFPVPSDGPVAPAASASTVQPRVLRGLTDEQRIQVWRLFVAGKHQREIATALDLKLGKVEALIFNVRVKAIHAPGTSDFWDGIRVEPLGERPVHAAADPASDVGWAPTEDVTILKGYARGQKSYEISQRLEGRSPADVVNRFKTLVPSPGTANQARALKLAEDRVSAQRQAAE